MNALIERAKQSLSTDLDNYAEEILKAYYAAENGVTVGLSIKLEPAGPDKVRVEHAINFVQSRIKEKDFFVVDFKQMPIFKKP